MYERHEHEQYFFDEPTLVGLTEFVITSAEAPCCLCAPLLGRQVAERGQAVCVLDRDERFADVPGFMPWDIYRPKPLDRTFDLILCDPPFFNASLSDLFRAIRMLARFDYATPLVLCYLQRRSAAVVGTFARFGLTPTGLTVGYRTVQASERNVIELFSNLPGDAVAHLGSCLQAGD